MAEVFDSWCVVELMGHVRMAGRVTEEQLFGNPIGRCDVPMMTPCVLCGGEGWIEGGRGPMGEIERLTCERCGGDGAVEGFSSVYFNGTSIYRLSPCSEEVARHIAKRNQPEPVHQWELPKPKQIEAAVKRHDEGSYFDPDEEDDEDDDSLDMEL